jgi:hypothetical protein
MAEVTKFLIHRGKPQGWHPGLQRTGVYRSRQTGWNRDELHGIKAMGGIDASSQARARTSNE